MEQIMLFVLQTGGIDPGMILGPLGALVLSVAGNVYQARLNKTLLQKNENLQGIMRSDSKESMQILSSMDKMLEKMISQLGDGENRIKSQIINSAENVKNHVGALMKHIGSHESKE